MSQESTRATTAPDHDNETGRRVFDDPHGRVAARYPVQPSPSTGGEPDAYMVVLASGEPVSVNFQRVHADVKVRAWGSGEVVPLYRAVAGGEPATDSAGRIRLCKLLSEIRYVDLSELADVQREILSMFSVAARELSDLTTYPSPHGTLVRLADVQCRFAERERNVARELDVEAERRAAIMKIFDEDAAALHDEINQASVREAEDGDDEGQSNFLAGKMAGIVAARVAFRRALSAAQATAESAPASAAPDELPAMLFDGYAVYQEVLTTSPNPPRTSPDNVAEVLDAVVRLMRAPSNSSPVGADKE